MEVEGVNYEMYVLRAIASLKSEEGSVEDEV
jgi:hypothetical protein